MGISAESVSRETTHGTTAAIDLIIRTLRGDTSWTDTEAPDKEAFARTAEHHGVHLLLWQALHEHGPAELIAGVTRDLAAEVGRSAVRERELARLLGSLSASGQDAIVFKGAALAHTCYAQPWMRPRLDTDLLVPTDAFDSAADALVRAGYVRSPVLSTGAFVSHQAVFTRTDDYGVEHLVDLHRRVLNPEMLARLAEYEDLRRDAGTIALHGTTIRVPSRVWSMALACAHRLVHHQRQERVIWLYDIHLLGQGLAAAEWEEFTEIANSRRISAICADGLAAASAKFGTVVPPPVLQALTDAGQLDPSRPYVARGVRRADVLRDDLRRLMRWRDRLRLLREHAFPSPAFMRSRYRARSPLLLPLLYAHRLVSGAYRWMRT